MIALYILLALVLAYIGFVTWAMRQPVEVFYHTFWSPFFRRLLPGMCAISLWRWVIMLYLPDDPRGRLSLSGKIHELQGHILNPEQWAGRPYTFPFLYLWAQIRHGYDANPYEEQARIIAGEPSRVAL